MKRHKIAVALVCVVLFAGAARPVGPEDPISPEDQQQIDAIPIEWYAPEGYFPEWYQLGDEIPYAPPNDPYPGYDKLGASIAREWYLGPDYFPYWYRMGDRIPWFSRNDPHFYLPELLPLWYQARWFSPDDTEFGYDTGGSEPLNSSVAVPEPGTFVLLIGAGLCLFGCAWRRRRRR